MELVVFDVVQSYEIFFGGFFTGLILFFIAYAIYSIFKVFNKFAKPQ